ncbi:hypothetical protein IFM89_031644, partial [Coptis chinensis]
GSIWFDNVIYVTRIHFHSLDTLFFLFYFSFKICSLEIWYYMALILFAGYLKNPEVSVDGLSICMNILGWAVMVAMGFNADTSVRVSNELGANHPRTAKFSVVVVVISSFILDLILSLILITTRKHFPYAFTSSEDVRKLVYQLTPLLAFSIVLNNVQPVLSGVAIGAGWQALVASVNIGCYYLFGIPLGPILDYKLNLGVTASDAEGRIQQWKGEAEDKVNDIEKKTSQNSHTTTTTQVV